MDALEVERSLAAGEPALQALLQFAREQAGTLEAHEAEQGLFKRRLPMGLAAMQRSVAQRGTGDVGPAVTRADGMILPREQQRRGRDSCARVGTCAGARTCDRTPGEPGIFPLDAQVNLPARCDAYVLQEWMAVFAVAPPCQDSAGVCEPLVARDRAERVWMAVAQEAPADDERFSAQRPVPPAEPAGERLVVRVDGTGVPLLKAEAGKLTATWGTGEKRQQQQAALVGVSDTVDATPRAPAALAELLVEPAAARARRQREATRDEAPRAQQVRRLASLVRTKPAVLALIQADAERRDPPHRNALVVRLDGARGRWNLATQRFKAWKHVTVVLDILPVVGDLWSAANAWCGEASQAGQPWVQQQLTAIRRGRVGYVIGGLRHLLTKQRRRQSGRQTLGNVSTCFHNHRRWRPYDASLARGWPVGTGGVEAACGSVVKHRMEGEGQRWSLAGAEAMLTWRSRTKSHDHDLRAYWRFRACPERGRLDARNPTYRPTPRLRRVA